NAFKDAVPIEKPVVKHRDPCLLCRHKVSIHIHLHDTSLHRPYKLNTMCSLLTPQYTRQCAAAPGAAWDTAALGRQAQTGRDVAATAYGCAVRPRPKRR